MADPAALPFDADALRAALLDPEGTPLPQLAVATCAAQTDVDLAVLHRARLVADRRRADQRLGAPPLEASSDLAAPGPTAEPAPILGYRSAADVLGIGREQVRRVVQGLPAHRRPSTVKARGGHDAVWWPSPEACRSWWCEVHAPPEPPAPRRRRKRDRVTTTDTRPLRDRLADL